MEQSEVNVRGYVIRLCLIAVELVLYYSRKSWHFSKSIRYLDRAPLQAIDGTRLNTDPKNYRETINVDVPRSG